MQVIGARNTGNKNMKPSSCRWEGMDAEEVCSWKAATGNLITSAEPVKH